MKCSMNLPAYPTIASSTIPGSNPRKRLDKTEGSVATEFAALDTPELAIENLFLMRWCGYQGRVFRIPTRTSSAAMRATRTASESIERKRGRSRWDIFCCSSCYELSEQDLQCDLVLPGVARNRRDGSQSRKRLHVEKSE